jgi:predicted nucleic acid-binding protein
MYLLGRNKGWPAQSALWRLIQEGVLVVAQQPASTRIANLMEQYRDLPMALADASLMDLAQERDATVIFSLDNDFHLYRMPKGGVLQVLP